MTSVISISYNCYGESKEKILSNKSWDELIDFLSASRDTPETRLCEQQLIIDPRRLFEQVFRQFNALKSSTTDELHFSADSQSQAWKPVTFSQPFLANFKRESVKKTPQFVPLDVLDQFKIRTVLKGKKKAGVKKNYEAQTINSTQQGEICLQKTSRYFNYWDSDFKIDLERTSPSLERLFYDNLLPDNVFRSVFLVTARPDLSPHLTTLISEQNYFDEAYQALQQKHNIFKLPVCLLFHLQYKPTKEVFFCTAKWMNWLCSSWGAVTT